MTRDWYKSFEIRHRFIAVLLLVFLAASVGRLYQLQILDQPFLRGQGDARALRQDKVIASRGMILDRQGEALAVSVPVDSLWFDPLLFKPSFEDVEWLSRKIDTTPESIHKKLDSNLKKRFVYLVRRVPPELAASILSRGMQGLYKQEDFKRYYPMGEITSHLLGFTNIEEYGQEGLEKSFDTLLQGVDGEKIVKKDRLGNVIETVRVNRPTTSGEDLKTTLDSRVQFIAYRALKEAVAHYHAKAGAVIVVDIPEASILAAVSQPGFNPNMMSARKGDSLRQRAFLDLIEPGSTIKPFAVLAALSSGINPEIMIDTTPGFIELSGYKIRDFRNYGRLNLTEIIQKSSNVGMTKLSMQLKDDVLSRFYEKIGFASRHLVDFPATPSPQVWPAEPRLVEKASMSYGYGFSITPLMLVDAYASIGRLGVFIPSKLTPEMSYSETQVFSAREAKIMLDMLEQVTTTSGTGSLAKPQGYRVGGKTGTSKKLGTDGKYTENNYVSLFVGLAPIDQPRLAILVMVDEPQGEDYYGGKVAAPVFKKVTEQTLPLLQIYSTSGRD